MKMIEFGKKDNFLALIEDYIKYYRGYSIVEITGISEEGNLLHINCATKFKKEKTYSEELIDIEYLNLLGFIYDNYEKMKHENH